jgi:hypothetical protein
MAWYDKLNAYIKAAYVPDNDAQVAGEFLRTISKWWLEFARNILVVSTLAYFAVRSDSLALKIFAGSCIAALVFYLVSYANAGRFNFFPYIKRPKLHLLVNGVAWIIVYAALYYGSTLALMGVFGSLKDIIGAR